MMELRQEVSRLRTIRECEKEIDSWSHTIEGHIRHSSYSFCLWLPWCLSKATSVFHIHSCKSRKWTMSMGEHLQHTHCILPSAVLQGSANFCHSHWLGHSGSNLSCLFPFTCWSLASLHHLRNLFIAGAAGVLSCSFYGEAGLAVLFPCLPRGGSCQCWLTLLGLLQHREVSKISPLSYFTQPHGVCDKVNSSLPWMCVPLFARNKCHQQ